MNKNTIIKSIAAGTVFPIIAPAFLSGTILLSQANAQENIKSLTATPSPTAEIELGNDAKNRQTANVLNTENSELIGWSSKLFEFDNIDPEYKVELTLNKIKNGKNVSGAKFRIYRLPIDVTEYDFKDKASKMTMREAKNIFNGIPFNELQSWENTTDSNGNVTFKDLTPGIFILQEINKDNKIENEKLAILPSANVEQTGWKYDDVISWKSIEDPVVTTEQKTPDRNSDEDSSTNTNNPDGNKDNSNENNDENTISNEVTSESGSRDNTTKTREGESSNTEKKNEERIAITGTNIAIILGILAAIGAIGALAFFGLKKQKENDATLENHTKI